MAVHIPWLYLEITRQSGHLVVAIMVGSFTISFMTPTSKKALYLPVCPFVHQYVTLLGPHIFGAMYARISEILYALLMKN